MSDCPFSHITIVGTGLIGGSIGLALREAGYTGRIIGVARKQTTLDVAIQRGCIDEGYQDLTTACQRADLVILCTPVSGILAILPELAKLPDEQPIITDAGSTKATIVQAAEGVLRSPELFVGSHPMAGAEKTGPGVSRGNLFQGMPCIITPTQTTDPEAQARVEQFWQFIGMHIVHLTAEEADHSAARISHVPHAVAVLLFEMAERLGGLDVSSTGFADVTRIASGDADLWADIFMENKESIVDVIDELDQTIAQFRGLVVKGKRDELRALLDQVKNHRDTWIKRRTQS